MITISGCESLPCENCLLQVEIHKLKSHCHPESSAAGQNNEKCVTALRNERENTACTTLSTPNAILKLFARRQNQGIQKGQKKV